MLLPQLQYNKEMNMMIKKAFLSLALFLTLGLYATAQTILEFVAMKLPENCIILEAGSYDGQDTRKMAELFKKATIYAFEPVPELFNRTYTNVKDCPNVQVIKVALSDKKGRANFFLSNVDNVLSASGSLFEPFEHFNYYPETQFDQQTSVDTVNLDEWCKENHVNHIDFMWLDMQGAELKVLKAAPEILKTVKYIWTEVAVVQTYKNIPLYPEVRSWFESQGFRQILMQPTSTAEANVLFGRN